MDDAARRIMEMKIEEAIAWHDQKSLETRNRFGGEMGPGTPGDAEATRIDQELYRMIRTATGIDA